MLYKLIKHIITKRLKGSSTFRNLSLLLLFSSIVITGFGQRAPIQVGADQIDQLDDLLNNKNIALVVNQTSYSGNTHLVDLLIAKKYKIKIIFSPEHGFKGKADAGEHVENGLYGKDKIPLVSLYGKNKKPKPDQLNNIDVVIFDIQDVGARFYTYISTMHYVMEACAEQNTSFIVLDRPNPMGMYVDGPVLEPAFQSFVGMHPIPIVHGLTVGELATMINGEQWLKNGVQCELNVIKCINYEHKSSYSLSKKPSPNLPNDLSIHLYPSLCLFEGTRISIGRGTYMPFQQVGYPGFKNTGYTYKPVSISGMSKYPKFENKVCNGYKLDTSSIKHAFDIRYLLEFHKHYTSNNENSFFLSNFFEKLAGTASLRKQLQNGATEQDIRASWEPKLSNYKVMRKKYLLYPDF